MPPRPFCLRWSMSRQVNEYVGRWAGDQEASGKKTQGSARRGRAGVADVNFSDSSRLEVYTCVLCLVFTSTRLSHSAKLWCLSLSDQFSKQSIIS